MYNVLITSEYFGKFSGEAKQLLLANGFSVTDNPYGHKFLTLCKTRRRADLRFGKNHERGH